MTQRTLCAGGSGRGDLYERTSGRPGCRRYADTRCTEEAKLVDRGRLTGRGGMGRGTVLAMVVLTVLSVLFVLVALWLVLLDH